MSTHSCTYSPDDDKLRMTPAGRLPADEYAEIKAAGFNWAPKQGVFYAVWTPSRERLMLSWCDEIEDDDTSLLDRAEVRADRFEDYSDKRTVDAERAHKAVASIADNIPFGQPILVGHHSEKRARKDAQKIENGMRHAVKMWDTADYWTRRAAGAIANAKYKELPAVRARRIKGLESDKRKRIKDQTEAQTALNMWNKPSLTLEQGRVIAGFSSCHLSVVKRDDGMYWSAYDVLQDDERRYKACPSRTLAEVIEAANRAYPRSIERAQVWIDHINNRLEYEKAMLAEGGGLKSDGFDFVVGGKVQHKWGWSIIKKLNKTGGVLCSLSLIASSWPYIIQLEDVRGYEAPAEGDTEKVKAATKTPPMCNYITPDCATMTQAEFKAEYSDHKGSRIIPADDTHGAHRIRRITGFRGRQFGGGKESVNSYDSCLVFISDAKVKEAPAPAKNETPRELPAVPRELPSERVYTAPAPTKADELRATLKAGIKIVSAPQLFPTPAPLAARMVELADIQADHVILEPSAGTGRIIEAVRARLLGNILLAVEINQSLVDNLRANDLGSKTITEQADFLEWGSDIHTNYFDRVIMNPPFAGGADIKHIKHAYELLAPGGKLVAICAGGPRQEAALKSLSDTWEVLPAGTFEESGTGVNSVMLSMSKPATVKECLTVQPAFTEKAVNDTADFQLTFEPSRYPAPASVQHVRARQANLF